MGGVAIFGHCRDSGEEFPTAAAAPLLRVRAFGLFGTTDVWRIPRGVTGSYRELIRALRSRRRELTQ